MKFKKVICFSEYFQSCQILILQLNHLFHKESDEKGNLSDEVKLKSLLSAENEAQNKVNDLLLFQF